MLGPVLMVMVEAATAAAAVVLLLVHALEFIILISGLLAS